MNSANLTLEMIFPDDLLHQSFIGLPNIPCVCRLDASGFEIRIIEPLPCLTGVLKGWERSKLELRAPMSTGGAVSYNCHGQISIELTAPGVFNVKDFSLFIRAFPGWFPIVRAGTWAEPVCMNTPEELQLLAEIEAGLMARSGKKKRGQ
ncbi:hypothetical protein ACQ859_23525 [Roseateles chitinivorans]|uniref:hypothetical protein n=1 Tax=Roseateles chitinivorans TaxID=2917965 RepID=UPI003D67B565